MTTVYTNSIDFSFFSQAQEQLNQIVEQLTTEDYLQQDHGYVEDYIDKDGQKILRRLLQGWLDMKASREEPYTSIQNKEGKELNHVKAHTERTVCTLFGDVKVSRRSYSQRHEQSRFLLDAQLNLSRDSYSDGLRYRFAQEVIKSSYDNAIEAIDNTTAGHVPKRQGLNLVKHVACDFESFYQDKGFTEAENTSDLLIISTDGKGIVMHPDSLRECTRKKAGQQKKLKTRLSQGEKKDRKRMAQVAAVYTVHSHVRAPDTIMNVSNEDGKVVSFRPPIRNKRVWASVGSKN